MAATGVVDFSQADFFDAAWWTRLIWLRDYVADTNIARLQEYRLRRSIGMLTAADPENFTKVFELTEGHRRELTEVIMPWLDAGPKNLQEALPAMRKRYTELFGDPDSPEFKAELQQLLDYWDERNGGRTE